MKQIIKFCVISLLLIIYEGTIFGQTFKKVTNISELQNGDVIAIVNEANNQALSTKENQKKLIEKLHLLQSKMVVLTVLLLCRK